jgi:hypothetical protein
MPCLNWVKSIASGMAGNHYGSTLEKYIESKNPKTLADIELYALEYERKLAEQSFKF